MAKTYCPGCDAVISVERPKRGAMVTCRECETKLEIISTQPFEVDFPLDYYDDSEDDWEDEDEY
jgi:lysine biosynthesis protein LysW